MNHVFDSAGLVPRPQQAEVFDAAMAAMRAGRTVVAQMPTGTGKSMVALSVAAARRCVVSTSGNELTAQYLEDCRSCNGAFSFARLIGRSHYLCATDAPKAPPPPGRDASKEEKEAATLARRRWLDEQTRPRRMEVRYEAHPGEPTCPGWESCSGYGGCGAAAAAEYAAAVDLVLTNHHKLACCVLFVECFAGRPRIVDEAHKLPAAVRSLAGVDFTPGTGTRLLLEEVHDKLRGLHASLIEHYSKNTAPRPGYSAPTLSCQIPGSLRTLAKEVAQLILDPQNRRVDVASEAEGSTSSEQLELVSKFLAGRQVDVHATLTRTVEDGRFVYGETIELMPAGIEKQAVLAVAPSALMMSATLPPGFLKRNGLDAAEHLSFASTYPWDKVLGFYPSNLDGTKSGEKRARAQRDARRAAWVCDRIRENGNAPGVLVLANAHADVKADTPIAHALRDAGYKLTYEKAQFEAARRDGHRVALLGSAGLALGVNLPGSLCECVVIWTCVAQPVSAYEESQYGSTYREQEHQAYMAQAVGRLLRSPSDTGIVVVADSRMGDYLAKPRPPEAHDGHIFRIRWTAIPSQ